MLRSNSTRWPGKPSQAPELNSHTKEFCDKTKQDGTPRAGRPKRRVGHNLAKRLEDHKEAGLRFLANPDVPFTNNQAERDGRMMKLKPCYSRCPAQ